MNAAILPDELISPDPRHLADVVNGETVFMSFVELVVKSNRTCYFNLNAELREKSLKSTITVLKTDDGGFHVTVPSDVTFKPGGRPAMENLGNLVPVASITVSAE